MVIKPQPTKATQGDTMCHCQMLNLSSIIYWLIYIWWFPIFEWYSYKILCFFECMFMQQWVQNIHLVDSKITKPELTMILRDNICKVFWKHMGWSVNGQGYSFLLFSSSSCNSCQVLFALQTLWHCRIIFLPSNIEKNIRCIEYLSLSLSSESSLNFTLGVGRNPAYWNGLHREGHCGAHLHEQYQEACNGSCRRQTIFKV